MENIDTYISDYWFFIGLAMFLASAFKNTVRSRVVSVFLFLFFCVVASMKSDTLNQDVMNYVTHFNSIEGGGFLQLSAGGFEPGYNFLVSLLSIYPAKEFYLFSVTFIPSVIFAYQFLKYRYSPNVILFIYATIILVAITATFRHYLAMSLAFVALNRFVLDDKKGRFFVLLPAAFHFSYLLLMFILLWDSIRSKTTQNKIIFYLLICLFVFFGMDFLYSLALKLQDRIEGGMSQQGGGRNILNIFLIFATLYSVRNFSIVKKRMNVLLWISAFVSVSMIPFYGINRIVSFFTLVILVFFHKYQKSIHVNYVVSFLSLLSLLFFYLNHSISGG